MKISIKDFLSLKNVEFEIEKGINVIAGLNGSGKSQLLICTWAKAYSSKGHHFLSDFGLGAGASMLANEKIRIEPFPACVLYRPAIRKLAESSREREFARMQPTSEIINPKNGSGYYHNYDGRYMNIYNIIANVFVAGNMKGAADKDKQPWEIISKKFESVFGKKLTGIFEAALGAKVGIELPDKSSTSFNSLSTGELEFISLLSDLLLEREVVETSATAVNDEKGNTSNTLPHVIKHQRADVILIDELDAHFHPDLQRKIIDIIRDLCTDKYVIITTHSPAVMLSVKSSQLFFLSRAEDCMVQEGESVLYKNQISPLTQNSNLFKRIADMYSGFFSDVRFADYMRDAYAYEFQKFFDESLWPSEAITGEEKNSADPQISSLRGVILAMAAKNTTITIIEVGCGKGRTLAMLKNLGLATLGRLTYIGVDIDEKNLEETNRHAESIAIGSENLKAILGGRFSALPKAPEGVQADICIFANVLHEFNVENLALELNKYIHKIKSNGLMAIYEVGTLKLGEMNFVMFSTDALKTLFEESHSKDHFRVSESDPQSHSGSRLMEMIIEIRNPQEVQITNEDVKRALEKTIEVETNKLLKHRSLDPKLDGIGYAFSTSNLANATIGKKLLEQADTRGLRHLPLYHNWA